MRFIILFVCSIFTQMSFAKPIEITFWHSFSGSIETNLKDIIHDFNTQYPKYKIIPIYQGDYVETLSHFVAAYRAHKAPDLVQIFEVGTQIMLHPEGIIKPVDDVMKEANISLPKEDFFQAARIYYSKGNKLMAMPFNMSIPVIFYNKTEFKKYGIKYFPKTWQELEKLARKVIKNNYSCMYTSAYPSWVLVDIFAFMHGFFMKVQQKTPEYSIMQKHLERLKRWSKSHYFVYGGRMDDPTILFTSNYCFMIGHSSGAYKSMVELAPFEVGVELLPYDSDYVQESKAIPPGGAAIWVVNGQPKRNYKAIAEFLKFFSRSDIQEKWYKKTGYIPLGIQGIYKKLDNNSRIINLAKNMLDKKLDLYKIYYTKNQMRITYDEMLEEIFANIYLPEKALKNASLRVERQEKNFINMLDN